jgi:hypothetical protein
VFCDVRTDGVLRSSAKGVRWWQVASFAFPYAPLVRCPTVGSHGRAPACAVRCRLSARRVSGLVRGSTHHPGSGRPPPSGRRPRAQPPSRHIGPPRASAPVHRQQDGCPLIPIHTRAGLRLRGTLREPFSRPSPDPIPGDVGCARRHALTRRTAAPGFSGEGPPLSALALCPAQTPNPTPPDPHHHVAEEARLRPGGDACRLAERGHVRRKSR